MKILLVTRDSNLGGGITSSAVSLCNELSERGHQVVFLDLTEKYQCEKQLKSNIKKGRLSKKSKYWNIQKNDFKKSKIGIKIKLLFLGIIKKLTIRSRLWYKLIFDKYKEYGEFDVAIAFRQCAPCYSFVLNKVKAVKKVAFVHGDVNYMKGNEKFFLPYMPKFYKVAFVSCAIKDNFIAKYPFLKNNASVIYNMFDSNDIVEKAKQKEELNIEQNKKVIVTVARIDNEIKQINWIPYICKELKQKCKTPFCWYVVGKGPDLNSNIELTKELEVDDVLKFVGERRNPFALENKADFTVLVSKSEAYPMTIIESFILKKPIVTTEFCAVHEMVVSEKNGLIVNQNIDDVVEGVIKFLNDSKGVYTKCVAFLKEYNHSNDIAYQQLMTAINM